MILQILAEAQALMLKPIPIEGVWRLVMLLPLSLAVSIVYKTIRCEKLSSVPAASLVLCGMIVSGMLLIGVALLLIFLLLA
jgi:hypothetical protein